MKIFKRKICYFFLWIELFWIRKSHNFFWFFCHYTYTSLLGQGMRKFSSFPRYGIVIFHLISSLMLIILKAIIFLIFFLLHLCHLFGTIRMRKFFFFGILDCDWVVMCKMIWTQNSPLPLSPSPYHSTKVARHEVEPRANEHVTIYKKKTELKTFNVRIWE